MTDRKTGRQTDRQTDTVMQRQSAHIVGQKDSTEKGKRRLCKLSVEKIVKADDKINEAGLNHGMI